MLENTCSHGLVWVVTLSPSIHVESAYAVHHDCIVSRAGESAHQRPVLLEPHVSSDGSKSDVCSGLLRREEKFMRRNKKAQ